ncbi:MAG TPA: vanadium-dependent haloperoxidase [Gammaproteobacteria bacterium]|nr:vanadium-dependent haloperoxidase [Gammaproteobacteria bacterium]
MLRRLLFILVAVLSSVGAPAAEAAKPPPFRLLPDRSVARNWSEALLFALRRDSGRVAYNARVVFQFSVAVYDAWAAYDADARPFLLGETVNGFQCPYFPSADLDRSPAAREAAISYAAYRYLQHRFGESVSAQESMAVFDEVMQHYGLDTSYTSLDYQHERSPAALGNYIGDCVIRFGLGDGSNEAEGYRTRFYKSINPPLDPTDPHSIDHVVDPDRWQKLALATFVSKTGHVGEAPDFETPEWGFTAPFAMTANDRRVYHRDGAEYWVYHDPGKPALISATDPDALPQEYIWNHSLVAVWSGQLDPTRGHGAELIDISPASLGNNSDFPGTIPGLRGFYDFLKGGDHSRGHPVNPATGKPYEPQLVPRADYARTLVTYWADGPFTAETPAGSMMVVLNEEISDSPYFEKRIGGVGPVVDDLEWDVKAYFAMSGAIHDAGVATWSHKGWYDSARPITGIRYIGTIGQSSDPADPDCRYHPQGIKYVDDPSDPAGDGSRRVVDCVRPGDPLADGGANVGKIKIFAWRGPQFVSNRRLDVAGVGWILAENWWPYQRADFVTPPFAGYTSGHSTLTSAGAQALTLLTGSPYFPSGLYEYRVQANAFLDYEKGPSVPVDLEWATYFDLADSAGISRLWAGVHPPVDDIMGRRTGRVIGVRAFEKAASYFSGKRTIVSDIARTE